MIITLVEEKTQAEMNVVNSKVPNKIRPQHHHSCYVDIPNEVEAKGNFGLEVHLDKRRQTPLRNSIENDATLDSKIKCYCRCCETTGKKQLSGNFYQPDHHSMGIYCLHSVQCYELPMTFSFLPNTKALSAYDDRYPRKYLADQKSCWPPPVFIVLVSILEIGVFAYDYFTVMPHSELTTTTIPSESLLIYRPDCRLQIWRFLTYMALHANCFHLAFNVIVQILYGLPLEMVHGSTRIAAIYLAGVLAGSLGTSVIDSEVYLVGASGGVYALLAAQLANVMINFDQMRNGVLQLVAVLIFVFCDTGYALYSHYNLAGQNGGGGEDIMIIIPSVSYIAHLTGSLAGFTIGLVVLKNFEHKCQSHVIRWLALAVYGSFMLFTITFNLVNTMAAQKLEEEGAVIKQHLLHNFGIS